MSPPVIRPGTVKICGVRTPEDATMAAGAGADLVGMIFATSKRRVTPERGREIARTARDAGGGALTVGVFVDAPADEIRATAALAELDLVQLQGDEPPELIAGLGVPVVKAIRPTPGASAAEVMETIERYVSAPVAPIAIHIDGYHPVHHGGSGVQADWDLIGEVAERCAVPIILAGGLTPENVADAIARARPATVDVSGGVEADGYKDPARVEAFIANAKAALRAETTRSGASRAR